MKCKSICYQSSVPLRLLLSKQVAENCSTLDFDIQYGLSKIFVWLKPQNKVKRFSKNNVNISGLAQRNFSTEYFHLLYNGRKYQPTKNMQQISIKLSMLHSF